MDAILSCLLLLLLLTVKLAALSCCWYEHVAGKTPRGSPSSFTCLDLLSRLFRTLSKAKRDPCWVAGPAV